MGSLSGWFDRVRQFERKQEGNRSLNRHGIMRPNRIRLRFAKNRSFGFLAGLVFKVSSRLDARASAETGRLSISQTLPFWRALRNEAARPAFKYF